MTDKNTTVKAPKDPKGRVFTFLLYPDSAGTLEDIVALLTDNQDFPVAISPLHDKDKAEGEQATDKAYLEQYKGFKKPHYHGIIVSNSPLTAGAIRKRLQNVLGDKAVGQVQISHSVKGTYEYLTHESVDAIRKKKHVYPKEDIVHINNFDIARYVTVSADERKQNMNILIDLICTYKLCNVIQLRDYVVTHPECGVDWAAASDVIDARGLTLRIYFDGMYQEVQREERQNKQDHILEAVSDMRNQVQDLWAYTMDLEECGIRKRPEARDSVHERSESREQGE